MRATGADRAVTAAIGGLMALGAVLVSAPTASGTTPAAVAAPVSITASIDTPGFCADGPTVRAVVDAPIADGPELTGGPDELVSDPCGFEASVSVDVDGAGRITIAPAVVGGAQAAAVTVLTPGIVGAGLVNDTLWTDLVEGCGMLAPTIVAGDGAVTVSWTIEDGCGRTASIMAVHGSTVLELDLAAPGTTTEVPSAASAASALPAFTG